MAPRKTGRPARHEGFTLAEMAIVMVVVMILLGGMVATLSGQMDTRNQAQTEQTLADIREALLGFAASQGRLPCPARPPSAGGTESPVNGSTTTTPCDNAWNGFVPGTTLGIGPTDSQGYVLDGWNQPIRYAITKDHSNAFTTPPGIAGSNIGIRGNFPNLTPNLKVCTAGSAVTGAGTSAADCDTTSHTLASNAVAVIYSTGKNWATGGGGQDERHNPNPNASAYTADPAFVSHDPMLGGSNEFDDMVIWLSPYILYSRMIAAGQLP